MRGVEIRTKLPSGKMRVTQAVFIPTEVLNRVGRHKAPDGIRQEIWRLNNPEKRRANSARYREKKRMEKRMEPMLTRIEIVDGVGCILDGAAKGDACDIEATLEAYEKEVKEELAKEFPGVEVTYRWENSDMGMKIDFYGFYPLEDYDEYRGRIHQVGEDVWSRGSFWVAKGGE